MNQVLQWNGSGLLSRVEPPVRPDAGEVLVDATHTLLELSPARALASTGTVRECGAGVELQPNARVVVSAPAASSALTVRARSCFVIEGAAEAASAVLIPPLAEVLRALRLGEPDLGSRVIVTGSDLRAELLLHILSWAVARSVVSVRAHDAPEPVSRVDHLFRGNPSDYQMALALQLQQARGPVLGLDTTSQDSVIQSLLASVPSGSAIVLLEGGGSGSSPINFYRDVHSKNLRIIGCTPRSVAPEDFLKASRLLEKKRIDLDLFHAETVVASESLSPLHERNRWALLQWSARSS